MIISALSNCAAKLSVEDCGKYMGQWKRTEGRVTFEENADSDGKLNHQMRRFKTYFYFNKGEVIVCLLFGVQGNMNKINSLCKSSLCSYCSGKTLA